MMTTRMTTSDGFVNTVQELVTDGVVGWNSVRSHCRPFPDDWFHLRCSYWLHPTLAGISIPMYQADRGSLTYTTWNIPNSKFACTLLAGDRHYFLYSAYFLNTHRSTTVSRLHQAQLSWCRTATCTKRPESRQSWEELLSSVPSKATGKSRCDGLNITRIHDQGALTKQSRLKPLAWYQCFLVQYDTVV